MIMKHSKALLITVTSILFFSTAHSQQNDLYQKVVALDSIFFKAYNECDIQKQQDMYADSIEFYHDKGGLSTSKADILEGTRKNICGKVTRELIKGSIEVSPIPGYGAIEMGSHMFHNNQEKDQVPHVNKFIIIWRNRDDHWTITRVISLH